MNDVRLRHLECFLAAAQTQSFTAAAQRLGISRPLVSKWMKTLEEELGLTLFDRKKDGVSLSPDGKRLMELAAEPLEALRTAIDDAVSSVGVGSKKLKVGVPSGYEDDARILSIVASFRNKYPEYEVSLEVSADRETIADLDAGITDVAFYTDFSVVDTESTSCLTLVDTSFCIAICAAHRLAHHDVLLLDALRNERFFAIDESADPENIRRIRGLCNGAGFEPRIARFVPNYSSLALSVIYQNGVTIATPDIVKGYEGQIKLYPLQDPAGDDTLILLWRKEKPDPGAILFAEYTNLYLS